MEQRPGHMLRPGPRKFSLPFLLSLQDSTPKLSLTHRSQDPRHPLALPARAFLVRGRATSVDLRGSNTKHSARLVPQLVGPGNTAATERPAFGKAPDKECNEFQM